MNITWRPLIYCLVISNLVLISLAAKLTIDDLIDREPQLTSLTLDYTEPFQRTLSKFSTSLTLSTFKSFIRTKPCVIVLFYHPWDNITERSVDQLFYLYQQQRKQKQKQKQTENQFDFNSFSNFSQPTPMVPEEDLCPCSFGHVDMTQESKLVSRQKFSIAISPMITMFQSSKPKVLQAEDTHPETDTETTSNSSAPRQRGYYLVDEYRSVKEWQLINNWCSVQHRVHSSQSDETMFRNVEHDTSFRQLAHITFTRGGGSTGAESLLSKYPILKTRTVEIVVFLVMPPNSGYWTRLLKSDIFHQKPHLTQALRKIMIQGGSHVDYVTIPVDITSSRFHSLFVDFDGATLPDIDADYLNSVVRENRRVVEGREISAGDIFVYHRHTMRLRRYDGNRDDEDREEEIEGERSPDTISNHMNDTGARQYNHDRIVDDSPENQYEENNNHGKEKNDNNENRDNNNNNNNNSSESNDNRSSSNHDQDPGIHRSASKNTEFYQDLFEWLMTETKPLVWNMNPLNFDVLMNEGVSVITVFLNASLPEFRNQVEHIRNASAQYHRNCILEQNPQTYFSTSSSSLSSTCDVLFVYIDGNSLDAYFRQLMQYNFVSRYRQHLSDASHAVLPAMLIYEPRQELIYRFDSDIHHYHYRYHYHYHYHYGYSSSTSSIFEASDILSFVHRYEQDHVAPAYMSHQSNDGDAMAVNDGEAITELTLEMFQSMVIDHRYHFEGTANYFVILFYADWCSHSDTIMTALNRMQRHPSLQPVSPHLVVARYNVWRNTLPTHLMPQLRAIIGYPSLVFIRRQDQHRKASAALYQGHRDATEMAMFVRQMMMTHQHQHQHHRTSMMTTRDGEGGEMWGEMHGELRI